MKVPELTKCCFCASVRTGTMIIAAISVAIALLVIILVCATNTDPRIFIHNVKDRHVAKIALIIGFSFGAIICGLLLLGSIYKNTALMLPWLVLSPVGIIINLLGGIVTIVIALIHGLIATAFWVLTSTCISFIIGTYLLLVVYTYYRHLQDEKRNTSQYAATWNP